MPYARGEHPFASKKQMRYLFSQHPEVAEEKVSGAKASGVSMIGPRRKKSFKKRKDGKI